MGKTTQNSALPLGSKSLIRLGHCYRKTANSEGMTLPEILIVLVAFGVLSAMAAPTITFATNPLRDTTNRFAGDFKLSRARAMSQTTAYRIRPTSQTQFIIERANSSSCAATTWTRAPGFADEDLRFDTGVRLSAATVNSNAVTPATNWSLCYDSRGLADRNLRITLQDTDTNETARIEVFPGGTVQIQ